MKRAVLIVAQQNFRDEELLEPKEILEKNNIKVTVASTLLGEITGKLGAKAEAEMLVGDIQVNDFDTIVFVGGPGAEQYFNDPVAHKLAQDAVSSGKIVGAICIAPVILANAGVLKGRRATVFSSGADDLKAGGAIYTARAVEKDGRLITADGPLAAKGFGEELVKALKE